MTEADIGTEIGTGLVNRDSRDNRGLTETGTQVEMLVTVEVIPEVTEEETNFSIRTYLN